ncbi:NrsF family protein [Alteraurantiacibacter aquimixticola]|uniref:DUF1109 domain-containing protein n=1 Tax=Alteraurantiacibacter aquimixticola TaxID=2489173 RepID=A0A4T3F3Z6_9SPHN|nr:NrsF family protein [Alteraurantiacibacter aquimixticola]TIX50238.1 DUF1109 domain-containing protein [Alteraurantiacibacter aquimixticola]
MGRTEDLITRLASEGAARQGTATPHFALPLLLATILCIGATALVLEDAFPTYHLRGWMPMVVKWGFSVSLLLLAALALHVLGRPGRPSGWAVASLLLPFAYAAFFVLPALLFGDLPFPGEQWERCLIAMGIMSPIGFGSAVMATRWLAPTDTSRAGLAAGFFGGAMAMTAYAPFCPGEGGLYFVSFYLVPILTMAGIGWLLGPRLLRW